MKKNNFFQNTKNDIAAFMFATLVVLGVGYFSAGDVIKSSSIFQHPAMMAQTSVGGSQKSDMASFKEVQGAMKELSEIGEKKAKLEMQKEKVAYQLKKADAKRDANYGMVPVMGLQVPQGLYDKIRLEKKAKSIDSKLVSLKKAEAEIVAKYGKDIHKLSSEGLLANN